MTRLRKGTSYLASPTMAEFAAQAFDLCDMGWDDYSIPESMS